MKNLSIGIITLLLIFSLAACSSSSSSEENSDQMAVFVTNTGTGDLDIVTSGNNSINFCYVETGCTTSGDGMSFYTVFAGQRMDLRISSSDRVAVGVKVGFTVESGEGIVEVVNGERYSEDGFTEFTENEVLFTSEPFSGSQNISFEVGDTD